MGAAARRVVRMLTFPCRRSWKKVSVVVLEHIVGVPGDSHAAQVVDDIVEKDIVKACQLVPQERIHERVMEHFVDIPLSQVVHIQ